MGGFKLNERLELAFNYLFYTGRNVFLTGKAGTGKTTFLKELKRQSPKRMVVTSPTGVAAVNAGGVTLHSFFQLPFGPQIPGMSRKESRKFNFQKMKIDIIRSLELLVIDEISMVRADLLDSVDMVLRRYRNSDKPFGGVQMLLIGDMQQLSPVVTPEDAEILRPYYDTFYFFGSKAWQQTNYVCIELNEVFRQTDGTFISILNEIRDSKASQTTIEKLNAQYRPGFKPPEGDDIVTLVTTNNQADRINQTHLLALDTPIQTFTAEVEGDFPESAYPVEKKLTLKKDSVVMFLKNDPSQAKAFYNGKIGRITGFEDGAVKVKCKGDDFEITVNPLAWENMKYSVDEKTKEITEEVAGVFKQIPLKTAWAVTIHKSQGLTFDKVMIDASNSFAHGQVYVALSRCRTLEGLILLKPLAIRDLIYDATVNSFSRTVEQKTPDNTLLIRDKRDYFFDTVGDLFDFMPLFNALKALQRQLDMAGGSVFGNYKTIKGLDSLVYENFVVVSEKFLRFIRSKYALSENIDQDETLLSRIRNGCLYYLDKCKTLLDSGIESYDFVSDDKTKLEKIAEATQNMLFIYNFKKAVLDFCKDEFSVTSYYSQKAKLSMPDGLKNVKKAVAPKEKGSKHFSALVKWREQVADNYNVEEREIISTKTLQEIANKKPHTTAALLAIKGMGGKAKKYAKDILTVLKNSGEDIPQKELEDAEYESLSTQEKTLRLYLNGRSVQRISQDRKISVETVLGHLAKYVVSGEVSAESLISAERLEELAGFIRKYPNLTDKEIVSGNKFSYGEIKIARAYLEQ